MKYLFSNKNYISKKLIFIYIIISLIELSKNIIIEENLFEINDFSNKYFLIESYNKSKCEEINLEKNNTDFSLPENSSYYIHLSSNSLNSNKLQIIYNINHDCLSNPEIQKSIDFSENQNLFVKFPKNNNTFYFNVQCMEYPCKFYFTAKIEKDYANLNYDNLDTYSYFMTGELLTTMEFKIPALNTSEGNKNALTIGISNPTDIDYIQLYLVKNNGTENKKLIEADVFKTNMEIILFVMEEFEKVNETDYYVLEIDSLENQFVSISIKNSSYDDSYNITKELKFESEKLKPNSGPKYSCLNYEKINETINYHEDDKKTDNTDSTDNTKIKNNIKDSKDSKPNLNDEKKIINITTIQECYNIDVEINNKELVYTWIDYLTEPIYPFFKRNGVVEIPKESFIKGQNSINLILNKKTNERLDICFKINKNQTLAFKIEITRIKKNEKYIGINGPLISGSFHTKSLIDESYALYTHISDILDYDKLSFYLKVIKGDVNAYMFPCNSYPNCTSITNGQLFKLNKINTSKSSYSYYSYKHYTNRTTDLSPFGVNQNLLYVNCSSKEEYCQFQILIYSDLDEIIPFINDPFFSTLQNSETELYRLKIPKNSDIEKIRVTVKSLEYVEFTSFLENNRFVNVNIEPIHNSTICDFIPTSSNSFESKDIDLTFNIKAYNNGTNYNISYEIIKKNETSYNIYNLTVGKVKELYSINSLPIKIFSKIKDKNKDLFFNFYFKSIQKQILNTSNYFDDMEVKATLINEELLNKTYLNKKEDDNVFKNKLSPSFDICTKSIFLNIKKSLIENNDNDILYITINQNKKNNERINKNNLSGKFFLFYKNDDDFIIPQNNYIMDSLTEEEDYISYHIKLTQRTRYYNELEFSSNVDISNLNITFHDVEDNIDLKEGEDFTYKKGTIHLYEFFDNTTSYYERNIIMKISRMKKINSQINFIFKHNLYSKDDYRIQFSSLNNNESQYILYDDYNNGIATLELKKIHRINGEGKHEDLEGQNFIKGEIYIRKIDESDKKEYENSGTLARINSKYELVKTKLRYKSDDEIEINININKDKKEYFSVIVDFPENNEKYVYYEIKKNVTIEDSREIGTLALILILLSICITLIAILIIIKTLRKRRNSINEKISEFKKGGLIEEMNEF